MSHFTHVVGPNHDDTTDFTVFNVPVKIWAIQNDDTTNALIVRWDDGVKSYRYFLAAGNVVVTDNSASRILVGSAPADADVNWKISDTPGFKGKALIRLIPI